MKQAEKQDRFAYNWKDFLAGMLAGVVFFFLAYRSLFSAVVLTAMLAIVNTIRINKVTKEFEKR